MNYRFYKKAIQRHNTKNNAAGKDLNKGSFILKCITIEPKSKAAKPKAAVCVNTGTQIPIISKTANVTFKKPTT